MRTFARVCILGGCLLGCSGDPPVAPPTSDRPDTSPTDATDSRDGSALDVLASDGSVEGDAAGDAVEGDAPTDASAGARWESLGCERRVSSIWGTGPSNVYFSVSGNGVLHLRPDGRTVVEANSRGIGRVWGRSATEVYAISGREVLRSSGDGNWAPYAELPETFNIPSPLFGDANSLYVGLSDRGGFPFVGRYRPGVGWSHLSEDQVFAAWPLPGDELLLGVQGGRVAVARYIAASDRFVNGTGFLDYFKVENRGISVWAGSIDDAYAVVYSNDGKMPNAIYRSFGGDRWTALEVPGLSDPRVVWSSGGGDVYVAQRGGTILHLQGGVWTTEMTPSAELVTVWGADANTVFAGGTCLLRRVPR